MTDRIASTFEKNKRQGKKSLITFITAGDPDIGTTKRLVLEMEKAGADLVELGVPFSDPVAEGPVIQEADLRALSKGLKIDDIFEAVRQLREKTQMPIVFLMYINCIFNYQPERFFQKCSETGVDGVIVPDLPFEEKSEISQTAKKYNIRLISLVAPTSHDRIKRIAQDAEGFLYCVSSLGVTGVRNSFETNFDQFFEQINQAARIPTALGFGISTPEQVRKLKRYADGIIVGSAIVRLVAGAADGQNVNKTVGAFVRSLRRALDE